LSRQQNFEIQLVLVTQNEINVFLDSIRFKAPKFDLIFHEIIVY